MSLYRLDASFRTEGSSTRQLADAVERSWSAARPDGAVIRRDVGGAPLPATAWPLAVAGSRTPEPDRSPEQADAVALAATLAGELLAADAYLFAVPLYNFGVAQGFKAWVDLLITDPRFRAGAEPALAGRPAVLVVARGGGYGPGTPREGWDHGTPWVRRILSDVLRLDLTVVEVEFTLARFNPAMEQLVPKADESLAAALSSADAAGAQLAAVVPA